jgi:hypothetical protein
MYDIEISPMFGLLAFMQLAIYITEIILTIYVYNQLKSTSGQCGQLVHHVTLVKPLNQTEHDVSMTQMYA